MFWTSKKKQEKRLAAIQGLVDEFGEVPRESLALDIVRRFQSLGQLGEALLWAKHGRETFPQSKKLRKTYQRIKLLKSRASLKRARSVAKVDPSAENLVRVAELHRMLGNYKEAFRFAQYADTHHPETWQVQLALGKIWFDLYSRSRSSDEGWHAAEHFDTARCLHNDDFQTLLLLSVVLMRLESYEDAQAIAEEALRVSPGDRRALGVRARLDRVLGARGSSKSSRVSSTETPESGALKKRVLGIPGAIGVYVFDETGTVLDFTVKQSPSFDFEVDSRVFERMASACLVDTQRIGLGQFVSCTLAGNGWGVDYHAQDGNAVLVFFEGKSTCEEIAERMDDSLLVAEVS